jgi:catechol 2,3-dioxygenase-like lactoylglutathione lyase family enzyme
MRLQHSGLVVSDLERSRRFYRDALGLEEVARPSTFAFAGAWFRFGEDEIHLLAESDTTGGAGQEDAGAGAARGLTHHLAFEVDDLAAACARLEQHGVPLSGPMPRGDGVTQVFFLDPDGYVLELFQWTGEDQSDAPARAPIRDETV